MEQLPQPAGDEWQPADSYGTDDPARQAEIEAARTAAREGHRRDRAQLERYVEAGLDPDDAEVIIEFEHATRQAGADKNDTSGEAEPEAHPQFYAVHVGSYTDGVDHGVWIEATNEPAELDSAISAMLDAAPSPRNREWAVGSTHGFAGISLDGVHDTTLIHTLASGVAEHGAAYAAWVDMISTNDPDLLAQFEDFYVGSYDNPEAWARSVAEDLDWPEQLDREITDPFLRRYVVIDYAKVAREGAAGWDVVTGSDGRTYVFLR